MRILSSSSSLKSHPDKFLVEHLENVGGFCKEFFSLKKLNLNEYFDPDVIRDVVYLIGVSHDFGKATSYFQEYINIEDETKRMKLKNKPETHHGPISAVFTYYIIETYLSSKSLRDKKYYEYLPLIGFLVVKRHHGNLHNADEEVITFDEEDDEILEKQINSMDFQEVNKIYNFLFSSIGIVFDCENIKGKILEEVIIKVYGGEIHKKIYIYDLVKEKKRLRRIDEENSLIFYFIILFIYSILLDADKTDATGIKKIRRQYINENLIDRYKALKFNQKDNKIDEIRNEIYEEVVSNVEHIDLDRERILSLNVPTGTGKTLTSLSFALKLRKRIEEEKGYKPRIIYSLPFLSIIDQNFDVFDDVFATVNKEKPTSDMLLKHHHLSDIYYTRKDDEFENIDKDVGKDLFLIEGWNSEIIVTTFIQFFYSFISNRNRSLRKFHNIVNSIIILDEVQAIPHRYWLLMKKTIQFFAEKFNTYFVFVTATQPLIFSEEKNEIKPLIKDKKKYFKEFDRVQMCSNLEDISIEEFKISLKEELVYHQKKDFLIVLNTISSSKEIYEYIKRIGENEELGDSLFYYLSTNIVPKERLMRINRIKEETNERKIVVSTQLIEAGVDIDADFVYRDYAPLDSINQVAGRCNRNFSDEKGIVKILVLKEEKRDKVYYPSSIYEAFLLNKTKDVLKEAITYNQNINESDFLELNKNYFQKVYVAKSDDDSKHILEYIEKLKFNELSDFELIKNDFKKTDVFIEIDETAEKVWQKYNEIISNEKLKGFEKKNEFLKIKKQFYEYVISVDEKKAGGIKERCGFKYVSRSQLDRYYDHQTGFKEGDSSYEYL